MKPWTPKEIETLKQRADESVERLSFILQRSKQAIYSKRREIWNLTRESTRKAGN